MESILALVGSVVSDQSDQPLGQMDAEELAEEQQLVARLVHLMKAKTNDEQHLVLQAAR